jgi:hypothetical protein
MESEMKINLDITGMYYRAVVDMENNPTVLRVMEEAAKQSAGSDAVMTFDNVDSGGNPSPFVNYISVEYFGKNIPMSRQSGAERPQGKYSYNDNKGRLVAQIPGEVSLQLAWQYYVTTKDKFVKNLGADGERCIIPAGTSNTGKGAIILVDGDTVTWRLVAIYGLPEAVMKKNNYSIVPAGSARELRSLAE